VRQTLERAGDKSDLLVQIANESLRIASESVRNAEADVKNWNELVQENSVWYPALVKVYTAELDKANKRLEGARERLKNERLKEARDFPLQLPQPARQVEDLVASDIERRTQKLLNTLEWREPTRLCGSLGSNWIYQGASGLVDTLKEPLVQHYDAWQGGLHDKQSRPLYLVVGGQGTGKSRMLEEMKVLLCAAAEQSKKEDLMQRMRNAYVFHVTFWKWHFDDWQAC